MESLSSQSFARLYDEERHLFDVVGPRFRAEGSLGAYDLFFIVRWKANRAISKVARSLTKIGGTDIERAARELTRDVFTVATPEERFRVVSDKWRLRLPMASAILTVLYPEDFTVYDVRACEMLDQFRELASRVNIDARWRGYLEFKDAVERIAPAHLSLRDKDRHLWAKSRHQSLEAFLRRDFAEHQHSMATPSLEIG